MRAKMRIGAVAKLWIAVVSFLLLIVLGLVIYDNKNSYYARRAAASAQFLETFLRERWSAVEQLGLERVLRSGLEGVEIAEVDRGMWNSVRIVVFRTSDGLNILLSPMPNGENGELLMRTGKTSEIELGSSNPPPGTISKTLYIYESER